MPRPASVSAYELVLLAVVAAVLVWSGIAPHDRFTWVLEVLPVIIGLPLLIYVYPRFRFTPLGYSLMAIHAIILMVGGRYTYAEVPLGFQMQEWFGFARNHYDRIGHFAQGFVPAIVAREILVRRSPLKGTRWLPFFVICFCLAFSAFYELIEFWTALATGEHAEAFLGTQGDPWDTQWDMMLALVGAISALLLLSLARSTVAEGRRRLSPVRLGPELAGRYDPTHKPLIPISYPGIMHRFPTSVARFRATALPALLSFVLLGCENAPAGAKQVEQAGDSAPPPWAPRAIQAPRPVVPADSTTDSVSTDSVKVDPLPTDSTGRSSVKPAKPAKPQRRYFTLPPADSALWPVKGAPEPLPGAIIPEHRIVAFYGNPLSKRMGILGEIDSAEMLRRLEATATEWAKADPDRKVLPALHLISVVAQGYPGPAKKYRLQMPDSIVERVASWAEERGWLLFLDIQPGLSTVEDEIPHLIKYLKRPYVHLSLDPEFAMKDGKRPGTDWMGRMDASEVNHAIDVLTKIVEENDLPPKVLVVHRFTRNMLTNASKIRLDPRVQVVIDMDGYGPPGAKMGAYRWFVVRHPVQYTGWKLFYKNDKPMMTPQQVLELYPKPMYIQYQ